jgi:hypothetical protein
VQAVLVEVVVVVVVLVVSPLRPAPPEDPPEPEPGPDPVPVEVVVPDPTVVVSPPADDVAVPTVVVSVPVMLAVPDECVRVCVATLAVVPDLPELPHAETPNVSASEPNRAASIDQLRPRTMPERGGRITAGPRALRARA